MTRYLRLIPLTVGLTVLALLSFTAMAHAANLVDPADGSADVVRTLYQALTGGHYAYAAALALVAAVALARRYGSERWPQLNTDAGSAALVVCGSFGATMAAALAGGGPVSTSLLWTSLTLAFAAAGGYTTLKHLVITPYVIPYAAKASPSMRSALNLFLWLFQAATPEAPAPAPPAPGQ